MSVRLESDLSVFRRRAAHRRARERRMVAPRGRDNVIPREERRYDGEIIRMIRGATEDLTWGYRMPQGRLYTRIRLGDEKGSKYDGIKEAYERGSIGQIIRHTGMIRQSRCKYETIILSPR